MYVVGCTMNIVQHALYIGVLCNVHCTMYTYVQLYIKSCQQAMIHRI